MQSATIIYLKHRVEIQLPDPTEDNTIHFTIYRLPGTYDDTLYSDYVQSFMFSAESDDPNLWVTEAVNSAVIQLAFSGDVYYIHPQEPDIDDSLPGWADYYSNESDYWIAEYPEAVN